MIYAQKYGFDVDCWQLTTRLVGQIRNLHAMLPGELDIVLHHGVDGTHSPTGLHPRGEAIDMHIELKNQVLPVKQQFEIAFSVWFGGIGIYPFWQHPGLHLDVGHRGRFWWRTKEGTYESISTINWDDLEVKDV